MARYAKKFTYPENTRLVDVVDVPSPLPEWAADDTAWLAIVFPTLTGFVLIPENVLAGALDNGDGTYTNPEDIVRPTP